MADIKLRMTVNGQAISREVAPGKILLEFIRDELLLSGVKDGCGTGECGACAVLVDGVAKKSCLIPVAKAQGTEIVTIEGLNSSSEMSVLHKAFCRTGGCQCGYCIPGFVIASTAILKRNPQAGREEIKVGLGGNLCRCTGYQKIIDAVELARDVLNGNTNPGVLDEYADADSSAGLGGEIRRFDAPAKVSGKTKYAGDIVLPDMLHIKVLRSPLAHAEIVELDVSAAEATPGVKAVITCKDVPGVDGHGMLLEKQPVLAREKVRFIGEGIAAVVAQSPLIASQALEKIVVRYEELPPVFDAEEAMLSGAPLLHGEFPGNILKQMGIRKGDVEKGFAESELIVEEDYQTQRTEHAYLEPEAGLAYVEPDGTLVVISPSQNITNHSRLLAKILAMPLNKIRMIVSPIGGGFGGKEDMMLQGILALAALKVTQPVKYVLTREESLIATTKRHPFRIHCKMGIKRDGRICAYSMRMILDGGAYGGTMLGVATKATMLGAGPYAIDNVNIDTTGVFTNCIPSGAMRTFGGMQPQFATESLMDICAAKIGMDPIEFRRMNAMRDGALTHSKQKLGPVRLLKTLDAVAEAAAWLPRVPGESAQAWEDLGGQGIRNPCTLHAMLKGNAGSNGGGSSPFKKRGRGIAAGWYGSSLTGINDQSAAWVEMSPGGTAKVLAGVIEMGEGIHNAIIQIAADGLGLPPENISLADIDSSIIPNVTHAAASRQIYVVGNAVASACRDARNRLTTEIADHWGVDPASLRFKAGEVWVYDRNLRMSMADAVRVCLDRGVIPFGSGSFTARGTKPNPEDGSCEPWPTYVFGAQVAEVEVDTGTGEVQVLGVWAAQDVGRIIDRKGVEGQIEGCVVMALGQSVMEDFTLVEGHATTPDFSKYILPTTLDVPHITSVIIDDPDPTSPLGSKGVGEPGMVPTAPAIINAIFDAVGVRINALPATPEKVLKAIKSLEAGN